MDSVYLEDRRKTWPVVWRLLGTNTTPPIWGEVSYFKRREAQDGGSQTVPVLLPSLCSFPSPPGFFFFFLPNLRDPKAIFH